MAAALLTDMVCLCVVVCLRGCSPARQLLCTLCFLSNHRRHVFHSNDRFYRCLLVPHSTLYRMFGLRLSIVIVAIQQSELVFPVFCDFQLTVHKIKNIFDFYGVLIVHIVDKCALISLFRKINFSLIYYTYRVLLDILGIASVTICLFC